MNSRVYKIWDETREAYVALKECSYASSEEMLWLQRLQDFAVPQYYGLTRMNEKWFLVMEYCEGRTLHELLKEQAVSFEQGLNLVIQWCELLRQIHRVYPDHVFCDLKPSNLMVGPDRKVTMIDMESIYPIGAVQEIRTTNYFAPPELRNGHVKKRTEIYSLGRILEQADAQVHPFFRYVIVRPCLREKSSERPSLHLLIHGLRWYRQLYCKMCKIPPVFDLIIRCFVEILLCFCLIMAGYVIIRFTLW